MDLKKALELARGYERTTINVNGLTKPTIAEVGRSVNFAGQVKEQNQSFYREKCKMCNRAHKREEKCPAFGETCRNCGKRNHFEAVCKAYRVAKTGESKNVPRSTYNKGSYRATASSHNKVNYLTEESYKVNVDEYAEFMRFKQGKSNQGYELNMVKMDNIQNDGPRANVIIDGVQVEFLVDTGTPINIIDEETFNKFKCQVSLAECTTKLYGYKALVPLPVMGEFHAKIEYCKSNAVEMVVVIKGKSECLLSYKTATKLNIIKMLNQVKAMGYKELKARFPKLFGDTMGMITGVEIVLEVDPNIKPIKQKLRPIAFHLRTMVEEEIKTQVMEGILERVDENSEPTEWISNLVIVPKSTGQDFKIRITSDSRAVNKAIKRTRFPGKTIEDVIYLVNRCRVFAKLDIKKAFHQLKLARRSRRLTTIITHIGL